MSAYTITNTRKDGNDPDRRIDALMVGGTVYSIDQVIVWIEVDGHTFWVKVTGREVQVLVRQHAHNSRQYLTTLGDGFPPNNLLALPDC